MAELKWDLEGTKKVVSQLQESSQNYTNMYQELLKIAGSMGSAYQSADNLAFVQQINGLSDDLRKMADKILEISQIIDKQVQNHETRVQENISNVTKLQN